jgi:hypothetical protein
MEEWNGGKNKKMGEWNIGIMGLGILFFCPSFHFSIIPALIKRSAHW